MTAGHGEREAIFHWGKSPKNRLAAAWHRLPRLWIKFALISLPFLIVSVVAPGVGLLVPRERALVAGVVADVTALTEAHAPAVAAELWVVDREGILRLLQAIASSPHVLCARARDSVSERVSEVPGPGCLDRLPAERRVQRALVFKSRAIGTLEVGYTTEDVESLARTMTLADSLALALVALAAGGGVLLAYRVTVSAPLARLTAALGRAADEERSAPPAKPAMPALTMPALTMTGGQDDEWGPVVAAHDALIAANDRQARALEAAGERAEEAERQVTRMRERLAVTENLASLGQLVAGVAHEINTPLGVALTAGSLLKEEAGLFAAKIAGSRVTRAEASQFSELAVETTDMVFANLTRAGALIEGFKRVAADQTSAERRRFDLGGFVNDVLISLSPNLRKSPHRVEVICPEPVEVDSYPGALAQVLTNLLMNSLRHAFDDARPGHIVIAIDQMTGGQPTPDDVTLRFSDDGKGIPADLRARVFDPFFTTRRDDGGSGLGLHLVHMIVRQDLAGEIAVDSVEGQGTTFTLTFPKQAPPRKTTKRA